MNPYKRFLSKPEKVQRNLNADQMRQLTIASTQLAATAVSEA